VGTDASNTRLSDKPKGKDLRYREEVTHLQNRNCPKNYVSSKILVKHLSEDIGYSLYTNSSFKPNDVLFEYVIPFSELRKVPDMHTIQVDQEWHWCTKNHPIQFTQHSCFNINCKFVLEDAKCLKQLTKNGINGTESNNQIQQDVGFAKFKLVALNNLSPGTVITVNYNSFEWEKSCSFIDVEAPVVNGSIKNGEGAISNGATDGSKPNNGVVTKGREVRGYKYANIDEQKFLRDQCLLFKHIENAIKCIGK
jgi:hypothetical protein